MASYKVYFGYSSQYESGNDSYNCSTHDKALSKFEELKQVIKTNFHGENDISVEETPTEFRITCSGDGSYAYTKWVEIL